MSSIQKQVQQVLIGAYLRTAPNMYRAAESWPVQMNVWNMTCRAEPEFWGGSNLIQGLDGTEFSNLKGYRLVVEITLNALMSAQSDTVERLIAMFGQQFTRVFWQINTVSTNTGGTSNVRVLGNVVSLPNTANYFQNLVLDLDKSGQPNALITQYVWANANLIYYNVSDVRYALNRDFTINKNEVTFQLRSVDLWETVPDSFTIT